MSCCSSYFHHSYQGWSYSNTEQRVIHLTLVPQSIFPSLLDLDLAHCRVRYPQNEDSRCEKRGSRVISFTSIKTGVIWAPKQCPPAGIPRNILKYQQLYSFSIQPLQESLESFNTSVKFLLWSSSWHWVLCYQPYCWRSVCNSCFSCTSWRLASYSSHCLFFNANNEVTDKGTPPYRKTSSVLKYNTLNISFREEWKLLSPSLLTLPSSPIQEQLPHLTNWDTNTTNYFSLKRHPFSPPQKL